MTKSTNITIGFLVLFVCFVFGFTFYKFSNENQMTYEKLQKQGVYIFDTPRKFTFNPMITANNTPFTKNNLLDHWTLMYFGFTYCPDVCPTTLSQLNTLMSSIAMFNDDSMANMQVVMITVDPARDTPEKLSDYLPFFNKEFIGVSGESNDIFNLSQQLNVPYMPISSDSTDKDYMVDHSANIVLINPKGDYHGFIRPPWLVSDVSINLKWVIGNFLSGIPTN